MSIRKLIPIILAAAGSASAQDTVVFSTPDFLTDLHTSNISNSILLASVQPLAGPRTVLSVDPATHQGSPIYSGPLELSLALQPKGPGDQLLCGADAPNGDHLIVSIVPGQQPTVILGGPAERSPIGFAGTNWDKVVYLQRVIDPMTQQDLQRIGIVNVGDPSSATFLTPPGWDVGTSCVSPDGTKVGVIRDDGTGIQIYLVDVSGGTPQAVTSGPGIRLFAGWDPNDVNTMSWMEADSDDFTTTRVVKATGVMTPTPTFTVIAVSEPGGAVGASMFYPDGSGDILISRVFANGLGVTLNRVTPAGTESTVSERRPIIYKCLPRLPHIPTMPVIINYETVDDIDLVQTAIYEAGGSGSTCYPNCDQSTNQPVLNVNDFVCFQSSFAAGSSYANCDHSTTPPVLNVNDFVCFSNAFAAGCP